MPYDVQEHRHRFAAWAAARAAQRGLKGATVKRLGKALEDCGVDQFVRAPRCVGTSAQAFEQLHRKWCRGVVRSVRCQPRITNFLYGRAAKLVAVYVKCTIVLEDPECSLARVAHPPIDGILLRNVARCCNDTKLPRVNGRIKAWSTLSDSEYYELISNLHELLDGQPFWMLEKYWPNPPDGVPLRR